jgi:peptidoglycan/xylan/chitin deacetylase (PgdA/CDA1 family)
MNGPASRHRLSPDELLVLSSCELVDIGAHTVTHPRLSSLPEGRQRWEIGACKAHLEQILGVPVSSFAYPYGDYSPTTITIVQDARFELACSTKPAIVRGAVDRFDLPRFHVHDMDAEEFLGWLAAAPVGF